MSDNRSFEIALINGEFEQRTKHSMGAPEGPQVEMPLAEILVLQPIGDGNVMLLRFTGRGDDCGDTWHQSVDEAKDQAAFEYENAVGMWTQAPHGLDAALEYARRLRRGTSAP